MRTKKNLVLLGVSENALIVRPYGQVQVNALVKNQERGFKYKQWHIDVLTRCLGEKEALHYVVGRESTVHMHVLIWRHGEVEVFTQSHYPHALKWLMEHGYSVSLR